jgi:hypothetical protein
VTLASEIEWMLPQLRAEAEARMTATCQVGIGSVTTDQDSLEPVVTFTDVVYTGRCRVRDASAANNTVDVAGQSVAVQDLVLSLPVVGSEAVHTGLVVQITANPHDAALVGPLFRIAGFHAQTDATARRFPITVVT